MNYDIIIVGAGLGGLTAGAKLAREGKKVLIVEQHSKPGGCATTFKRGEFTLEVGLHEMDGPSPGDMKTRIFNELDVFNNIKFIKVPEFYRFINGRTDIVIPHDPAEASAILKRNFPEEHSGIEAFFDQILKPKKKQSTDIQTDKSLGEFLDSIFRSEEIKLVLLGNLGYLTDDPYSISLAYYSIAQGSYFNYGASYIRGGSQKLSDHLAGYIAGHGGTVQLGHTVTGLLAEGNRIKGIEYTYKKDLSKESLQAYGSEVIFGGAIPGIPDLLPEEYREPFKNQIAGQKTGASLLTIYYGFKDSLKAVGNQYYSTFVFDSSVQSQKDIAVNNRDSFAKRSFAFVDYGQIDSGIAPAGKSVGGICCIDYLSDWENLPRNEYNEKKKEAVGLFTGRLEQLFPGIKNLIEICEGGTSATIKRYTLNTGGAVYGFAQNPSKTPVNTYGIFENLHYASSWGKTGGGFSGAIYGGYLCAINVLRKLNLH